MQFYFLILIVALFAFYLFVSFLLSAILKILCLPTIALVEVIADIKQKTYYLLKKWDSEKCTCKKLSWYMYELLLFLHIQKTDLTAINGFKRFISTHSKKSITDQKISHGKLIQNNIFFNFIKNRGSSLKNYLIYYWEALFW